MLALDGRMMASTEGSPARPQSPPKPHVHGELHAELISDFVGDDPETLAALGDQFFSGCVITLIAEEAEAA